MKNKKLHGIGKLILMNMIIEGQWKDNILDGFARIIYNNDVYY